MKRVVTLGVIVAGAVVAALLPEPPPAAVPLAGVVIDRPGIESPIDASIWYCAWAQANAERDSAMSVASMAPAEAEFTFPVAIPGEPADTALVATLGPGAAIVTLSDVAQRGDSPAFVEFSDGPAAAAVTVVGDVVASDQCVSQGPDEWFFAGGSTMTGEALALRLFNPFPEVAKVTVTGFSEIGVEALGALRSISVNPRSWRDISFEELLRQRQSLILSVRADEGLVVPAMSFRTGTDEAWWGGSGLSTSWEFPVTQAEGTDAALVIAHPGVSAVDVTIDLYGTDAAFPAAFTFTVDSQTPLRVPLAEIDADLLGARVSSTGPVAAGVVGVGPAGTGVTTGAAEPARTWLLPGLRTQGLDTGALWLLNTSEEPIAVTVGVLTGSDILNSRQTVDPGRLVVLPVTDEDALGYIVSAAEVFSAGWTVRGPSGIAFATGIAIPNE
ncbi:MAG: hypothetical protein HZA58_00830 [Acidimicrobiia bacterium]|nr:hypothetical protein [Acidimicrobiia bacterium]